MIKVHGKPFLEYQIELLRRHGIMSIVLCVGYLGHMVKDYFGDGSKFGVDIRYSDEGQRLLGTAGALKRAEPLLDDEFFPIYGDSYLLLDYAAVMDYFQRHDRLTLMVIYRNENRYERSNVAAADGFVLSYDKEKQTPEMVYINYGVSVLQKEVLRYIPSRRAYSQEELYHRLIQEGQILAYETTQRFYEVGSPQGRAEFGRLVASGVEVQ
jgi:NDP-sugar pyrophosphorylase family protein